MIYYKIRSKKNPTMFRKADGSWNTSGKVYDTLGKLRTILTLAINHWNPKDISDWEIVEYEVTVKAIKEPHEVMDPKKILEILKR